MKLPTIKRKDSELRALSTPEQQIANFQNAVDKMFSDFWRGWPSLSSSQSLADWALSNSWWPKTDISETDKEFKLKLNVPNVNPNKINIEADDNSLIISGATEKEERTEGENWYRAERETGEFRRVFDLPSGVDTENIKASAKHGTLTVTLPKKPEAQKKKVTVDVQS